MVVFVSEQDSLESIAAYYHTTVEQICKDNALSSRHIFVGMGLLVHGYIHIPKTLTSAQLCSRYLVEPDRVEEKTNYYLVRV